MDKIRIEPQTIKSVWGFVRPKLMVILKKSPEDWIPEDVYTACVTGQATMWIATNKVEPKGFIVGRILNVNTLHIWVGYANTEFKEVRQWEIIEEIARECNCSKISFESWRKGWCKKAMKLGFSPRTYIKELL